MTLRAATERTGRRAYKRASIPCSGFTHTRSVDIAGKSTDVVFRAIQHGALLKAASELLNDRYAWRGYGATHTIPSGVHHTTFTAEVDGAVVGTITLAIDSDRGLAIDDTFADEMREIRRTKSIYLCELIRLAFHSDVRSHELMANLFQFTFIVGTTISDCTDLLIEVAPRHAVFYQAMLGFQRVGPLKTNTSVGSPSQLMRLEVRSIPDNVRSMIGKEGCGSSRSMYTHFFSESEETSVRLALMSRRGRDLVLNESREKSKPFGVISDVSRSTHAPAFALPIASGHDARSAPDMNRAA